MKNIMYELIFKDSKDNRFPFYFAKKHHMMRHYKLFEKNFFSATLSKYDGQELLCCYDSAGKANIFLG